MRRFSFLFFSIMILLTLDVTAFSKSLSSHKEPPIGPEKYTEIRAEVVDVQRSTFPSCRLTLNVTYSSKTDILNCRGHSQSVVADNHLRRTSGLIDSLESRNIGAIAAYYLLQGDEIHAKLFLGSGLSGEWYIYGIQRMGYVHPKPALGSMKMYDKLELSVSTDRGSYGIAEPIQLTLALRNTGKTAESLKYRSSKRYDFIITQADRVIWSWSVGKMFLPSLSALSTAPGETLKYTEAWRQVDNKGMRVPPGEYQVTAVLTTETTPLKVGPITVIIRPE